MQDSTPAINPTPEQFRQAIEEVRARYQEQGYSLWDIGDGLCEDFTDDVLTMVIGEGWQTREGQDGHRWSQFHTDWFYDPNEDRREERWNWTLLSQYCGINIPEDERARYDAIANMGANHVWIYQDGRHYDCEHPEGVESFFDLNFFRRYLELAEKLDAA